MLNNTYNISEDDLLSSFIFPGEYTTGDNLIISYEETETEWKFAQSK